MRFLGRIMRTGAVLGLGVLIAAQTVLAVDDGPAKKKKAPQAKPVKVPSVGYSDTPFLPDGKWRVHDIDRPHPRVVTPGTASTQETQGKAPSDAIVLFDGTDLSHWYSMGKGKERGKMAEPGWKVENGYLEIVSGQSSIISKEKFGDCQIHIEWATPVGLEVTSQARGNSGVIIMRRYEIQVLDSFENVTYADGQAASIYGQYPPLVNASREPGQWQSYDIVFEAPRFEGEKLVKPAYQTVFHNGVVVHNRKEVLGPMRHKFAPVYEPHEAEDGLMLQAHGNPIRFRNIWVRPLTGYDEP